MLNWSEYAFSTRSPSAHPAHPTHPTNPAHPAHLAHPAHHVELFITPPHHRSRELRAATLTR